MWSTIEWTGALPTERDESPLATVEVSTTDSGALLISHTEVDPSIRGQGIARALVMLVVERALREGRTIVPRCPYAASLLSADRELSSLISRS
jgi:predicted GNAT family acetyltransferase